MLLIRTTSVDPALRAFIEQLARASGDTPVIAADEQNGVVDAAPYPKIVVDRAACRRLGLYTPTDFAWRCGDYCFYVAAERYPDENAFWLIDFDARIACASDFFKLAASHREADLLVGYLAPAAPTWHWRNHASARDVEPWRCFFPVVRLSRRAIELLLHKRRSHSRQITRRRAWPNDEVFVATTMAASGLNLLDFNSMSEQPVCERETYSFRNVIKLSTFAPTDERPRLYHPVLNDAAAGEKLDRISTPRTSAAGRSLLPWKLCQWINSVKRW